VPDLPVLASFDGGAGLLSALAMVAMLRLHIAMLSVPAASAAEDEVGEGKKAPHRRAFFDAQPHALATCRPRAPRKPIV